MCRAATEAKSTVLLIKGGLLMRYPGALIYASRTLEGVENTKLPVFRGTISPDINIFMF